MKFDRQTSPVVVRDILAALKGVEEKHGIKITQAGRGLFNHDGTNLSFKLDCDVVGKGGENLAEKNEFERDASLFGFKPEHYGAEFTLQGETYRLTGFSYRARAMPIKAVRVSDNAPFKFRENAKAAILRQLP